MPSHYLNQYLNIVNWTVRKKLQWHFDQNSYIFIEENAIWKCRLEHGGHFVSALMCSSQIQEESWRINHPSSMNHCIKWSSLTWTDDGAPLGWPRYCVILHNHKGASVQGQLSQSAAIFLRWTLALLHLNIKALEASFCDLKFMIFKLKCFDLWSRSYFDTAHRLSGRVSLAVVMF